MARASEQLFFRGQQQVSPLNMYTRRIGTWRHYGAGRTPPTVMEELMQRAGPELERLEELIDRCEEEIRACILQIVQVESKLSEDMNTKDEVYWRKKEEQLRKKEEQLRKKEEQLREEKALLIGRPAQPDAKFDTDMCLFIEAATRMNLDGSDSDVGMHAFETVDGTRLTLPGDAEVNLFDGQLFVRDCYPTFAEADPRRPVLEAQHIRLAAASRLLLDRDARHREKRFQYLRCRCASCSKANGAVPEG